MRKCCGRSPAARSLSAHRTRADKLLKFVGHPDEANPALGVPGHRIAHGNPALSTGQLDAIRNAADSTGVEPWVMAPMVARCRRPGASPNRPGRVDCAGSDDRGARGGAAGRSNSGARRISVDRDQRPRSIHHGCRPDVCRLGDPHRSLAAGGLALVARRRPPGSRRVNPSACAGGGRRRSAFRVCSGGLGISSLSAASPVLTRVGAKLASVTMRQCQGLQPLWGWWPPGAAGARAAAAEILH